MLIQLRLNHFFAEEERELAEVILKFKVCGFPLSMYRVHLLAFQYAHINSIKGFSTKKKNAGYKWAKGYLARNPDIVVKKCSNLSVAMPWQPTLQIYSSGLPSTLLCWNNLTSSLLSRSGLVMRLVFRMYQQSARYWVTTIPLLIDR